MVFIIYNKFNKSKYEIKTNRNGLYKNEVMKFPCIKLTIHLVDPQPGQMKP